MPKSKTAEPDFLNRNSQVVIRDAGLFGTDQGQTGYQLGCAKCGDI